MGASLLISESMDINLSIISFIILGLRLGMASAKINRFIM